MWMEGDRWLGEFSTAYTFSYMVTEQLILAGPSWDGGQLVGELATAYTFSVTLKTQARGYNMSSLSSP